MYCSADQGLYDYEASNPHTHTHTQHTPFFFADGKFIRVFLFIFSKTTDAKGREKPLANGIGKYRKGERWPAKAGRSEELVKGPAKQAGLKKVRLGKKERERETSV